MARALETLKTNAPGVGVCVIVAFIAHIISALIALPIMLVALLLGIACHALFRRDVFKGGVQFSSTNILKLGVVLIGARIAFFDLAALGFSAIILVVFATLSVIAVSILIAKLFKIERNLGLLIGGATAICGASAAIALSSVMPQSKEMEKQTLITIVGVTAIGTILMIGYPFIISILGVNHSDAAILIGGTIHDVAQVVGAGYSVSEEVGDRAILVKLIRVFMLLPVLLIFAILYSTKQNNTKRPAMPLFIVGFMILVCLTSFHVIPDHALGALEWMSKWFLIVAITAVGIKTSFKELFSLGWRPIVLLLSNTFFISLIYIAALYCSVV